MSLYQDHILPRLIDMTMRQQRLSEYRRRVIPAAKGNVLEIGVGSGLNFPFYSMGVEHIIGLDPSSKLLIMAKNTADRRNMPAILVGGSAEAIPLADKCVDTAVITWALCSIPDVQLALGEIRRVLKPYGRMHFVEHGRAPDSRVRRWQNLMTPLWRRVSGGCHLNRPIDSLIEDAGFRIERLDMGYMRGPKPMTFMYEGSAKPR